MLWAQLPFAACLLRFAHQPALFERFAAGRARPRGRCHIKCVRLRLPPIAASTRVRPQCAAEQPIRSTLAAAAQRQPTGDASDPSFRS
jgi:hypothetical protein